MSDSIKVAIKARPLIKREKDESLTIQWTIQGNTIVATDAEMRKRGDGGFQFDHIFDMNATNNDVFHSIVKPIVDAAVNGFNGTVFAYGQTSSGKTYTMMGSQEEPGIIPLAIEHMFDAIANTPGREFLLRVSYLEIYNETVNDLLNKNETDLKVHEDPNGQVFVKCKEEVTNCPENVLSIMLKGDKNRRIGETNMNERSSRSHTIFRITIESRETDADSDDAIQVSQLNMVDLAGSERARQTGATGERFREGRHINLSLSTLALVIKQLSETQDQQKYINFRDSKLTRLLQTSLGGNAMTAIICAVTSAALEETQCTLSFASRARSVKNKPQLNEVMSDGVLLKRYSKQIEKLLAELERMKKSNRSAEVEEMESKMQEKDRINECLEERIRLLQTRIVPGDNRNNAESFKCKAKRRRTWCGTSGYKSNTSAFNLCTSLSPIKEMSPLKSKRNNINSTNIMDSSFQIAYADFELELIKSETEHEEETDNNEDTFVTYRQKNHVKFKDNIIIHKSPTSHENSNVTPEKINMYTQTASQSPGTPKELLRERISYLTEEYSQLREYTTLEKQLYLEAHQRMYEDKLSKFSMLEKELENVTSDKNAFEHIASELRKKVTAAELRYVSMEDQLKAQMIELQRIPDLEKKLTQLSTQEIQNISELQNQITLVTAERDEYKHIATELRKELNESEKCNILLEDQIAKQDEEPLIRFSIGNEDNKLIELEACVTNLKSEKNKLEHEISHLQNKLMETESYNSSMKNKLNDQQIAFDQSLQNLEERISNLTSERNAFERTVCEMQSKLREVEGTSNSIKGKLNEQQLEVERFTDQQKWIEKIVSQKGLGFSYLQEALTKTESMVTFMTDEMNEYQQDIHEFGQLEEQLQDVMEEMETERYSSEMKNTLGEEELMNISVKTKPNEQQSCVQETFDLEAQIDDQSAVEENEFERIVAGMKRELAELSISFENKPDRRKMDDLQITNDILTCENYRLKHTISELQEKLKETELHNRATKVLNTQWMEVQAIIEEQKDCVKNGLLEGNKLKDTIHELQEKSKKEELHSDLMNDSINKKELKLENTDLKNIIEQLVSKKNELEFIVQELQEKLAKVENNISTQNKPDGQQSHLERIQELETQVARLTSEKDEYKRISIESYTQSVRSPPKKESAGNRDSKGEINHLKSRINDLHNILQDIQGENARMKEQVSERLLSDYEYNLSNGDSSKIIEDLSRSSLEEDSAKLSADLILKTQELDEIKHDVQSLKEDIVNLQKTVYLLTTENTELANKLSTEKIHNEKSTMHLQKTIDELYTQYSKLMINLNDKLELENNLKMLKEQMQNLHSNIPEDNLKEEQIIQYEEQINALTAKNTDLLFDIADRMKELETLKENKSLYEHDCIHKDKLTDLMKKYEYLTTENNELSTDLIDKIEENDGLRMECDILKSKLELSLKNKENVDNNDAEQLRTENILLKTELVEMKLNIKALTEENLKISNQLIDTIEDLDNTQKNNTCNSSLHMSMLWNNALTPNDTMNKSITDGDLETRISNLQEVVNHLTHLNRKLSNLKLSTCTQCTHLKELNEDRKMLKFEVKSLTHKLAELQRKFDSKHARTDALIMKAREDINTSLCNSTSNSSFSENMNVTFIEETLQSVNNELQYLKEDPDKSPDSNKEKHNEIEELQDNNATDSASTDDVISSVKKSSSKTSSRLDNIIKVMSKLQKEFQEIKENNLSVRADLNKFTNDRESLLGEINTLKIVNGDLLQKLSENELARTAILEKASILENKLTDMTKKLQEFTIRCKEIENTKLLLETEAESLKEDNMMKERTVGELRQSISCLERELDLMKKQKEEFNDASNFLEQEYEKKLTSLKATKEELTNYKVTITQEFADYTKQSESKLSELNEKMDKYISENNYLKQEMIKLRDVENKFEKMRNEYQSKFQEDKILAEDNKKLKEILNNASKGIIKEIKSLKPKIDVEEFVDKSVEELFQVFLQTILAKEKEIVTTMQKNFDKKRQKLEDEKQQSVDAEKRITLWAKELESETEKLQGDLSERENKSDGLQKEVTRLQQLLEENDCDRDTLRDKINLLETDFSNLQIELDRYSKIDTVNEEAIIIAQKREKQAQEAIKNKEIEFKMKLKSEKEANNKRVEDLMCTIESFRTKNMDLMSNIEGFEANQKQLKNIIDLKTNELMRSNQIIQTIQMESKQLAEAYNDLNQELEEKKKRIAEVTGLLKAKCDKLTEYEANLETIVSENKFLKQQINERKASIEKYKTEIETLRMANKNKIDVVEDNLKLEQLKNIELSKQITELNNKNTALMEEMNALKNDYEALQSKCITLEKRVRNSTSKVLVEEQIEELKDLNTSLRNNLDGASNRITELQTTKTDLMKQLISLNSQYDVVCRENEQLKESLLSCKSKHDDANATDEKFDTLLREKNQIALELEAVKVELNQRNKEMETYMNKIEELTEKNTELDREAEELAEVIRQYDVENAKLQDQFYSYRAEIETLEQKIEVLEKRDQSLLPQSNKAEKLQDQFYSYRAEIETLEQKIEVLEKRDQSLLPQSNKAEKLHDDECNCATLKNEIREMQLEVMSKNGKIATLELQIRSGNFPYQTKCQELQENLLAYSDKNSELKAEVKRLQLAMLRTGPKECDACKHRLINRRSQACQTINMPNNVLRFCGISSGIIEDEIKIMKLEKEKKIMKDLCRSRSRTIKELEKQIEEYEMLLRSKDK